jgi:spermidine dehydrogenase
MSEISRRDFLDGFALAIAAGLTPAMQVEAQPSRYPPALTGLRGQHVGSFEAAHAIVRVPAHDAASRLEPEERYDLVVVGGGISGLAAAHFYRRARPQARILVLDNHDDFGGHAKRNEFTVDGRLLIGYGGSQSIDSPQTQWSAVAKGLLRDLGVDVTRFETAFDQRLYASLGLSRGLFLSREHFGRDVLVAGDPLTVSGNATTRALTNARPLTEFVADLPITEASRRQLLALFDLARDPLAGRSGDEKLKLLKRTSYRDYLTKIYGCSEEVANCFQGRTHGFFGLGCDAVPAADLRDMGYPGFAGLGLPSSGGRGEPYIYHFPDGNASLARLLVRSLVPGVAPGSTMDNIVLAPFDYGALDQAASNVRRCAQRPRQGACRLYAGGRDASRRGKPYRARLLPHGDPASDAGTCGGAARGACAERQDADRLYQCGGAQLAPVGGAEDFKHCGADVLSHRCLARFPGQPRWLSPSARPVRADGAASRACRGRAQPWSLGA